jgi:hypothetical protein
LRFERLSSVPERCAKQFSVIVDEKTFMTSKRKVGRNASDRFGLISWILSLSISPLDLHIKTRQHLAELIGSEDSQRPSENTV